MGLAKLSIDDMITDKISLTACRFEDFRVTGKGINIWVVPPPPHRLFLISFPEYNCHAMALHCMSTSF
jgi:hypothetical protein